VLAGAASFAPPVLAGPANPKAVSIPQPDGSTFMAHTRGDEFLGWTETTDGYTVLRNASTGYFEYAAQGPSGDLRPSGIRVNGTTGAAPASPAQLPPKGLRPQRNTELQQYQANLLSTVFANRPAKAAAQSATPTGVWAPTPVTGPKKILVILVNFLNASLSSGASSYWSNAVHGASSSVAKYYQDNSFGAISIAAVPHTQPGGATGVVTVSLAQNHPNCGGDCYYPTESTWVNGALAAAAPYVNFAALDTNSDGTISVDETLIYFVLAGYETSGGSGLTPSYWAHAWGGANVSVAGKSVNHWALNGEMYDASNRMPMGIIAHEMGHAMGGLPDLYDINDVNEGLGIFSLMAGGSWGRKAGEIGGTTPVALDALSRQYLGWSTPQFPNDGSTISFPSALSGPTAPVILMNSALSTSEYWLVENRPPVSWDAGMYDSLGSWSGGLLIQHIDLNIGSKPFNDFNAYVAGSHQGAMAEEPATASCSLKTPGTTSRGCPSILWSNTTFDGASNPRSSYYSGAASGLSVTGISAASSNMTATVSEAGTNTLPTAPTIGSAVAGNASIAVAFTPGALGSGTLINRTADCGGITATGINSPITVYGLTNGTTYTCRIRTTSTVGAGPWSAPSNAVTPLLPIPPSAPTIGTATAGDASANVAFTPGALGNGTLVNYTADCGGITASGSTTPITVSGLTNGLAYTCKVMTTTSMGGSPWSAISNTITPIVTPGGVNVALAANGGVVSASSTLTGHPVSTVINNERTGGNWTNGLSWADNTPSVFPDWVQINFAGPRNIDKVVLYTMQDAYSSPSEPTDAMTFSLFGITGFTVQTWDGAAWVTQATITGNNLIKRTINFSAVSTDRIRVNITATKDGTSYISEIEAFTAGAPTAPSAPTIGTATAGDASASVAFTPGALGSGTLTNYTADCSGITATGSASPITVTGLTNGVAYTCKVKTTSSVGTSAWSANSNSVTPTAAPVVPVNVALTSNGGVASASSAMGAHAVSAVNNDERKGNWNTANMMWSSAAANTFPNWVQINFNGTKTINKVVLYTMQDVYGSPAEPTDVMTFTQYGATGYTVQTWDGAAWITQATITANNLVKRTVNFSAVSTDRIRVNITSSIDGYAYLSEVEAWTVGGAPTAPSAPTIGTATAGDASASVAFTPGALGSGTLTNYTADCSGITATGSASPITVTGLTNGVAYTCKVKTTSSVGTSAWSANSNSVTPTAAPVVPVNVALTSNGGVASASSAMGAHAVSAVNNDERKGNWNTANMMWSSAAANTFPNWVQINFNGTKTINKVVLYTMQDVYGSPAEPTDVMTFTQYGATGYTVQTWDGAAWITQATITANNLVKRTVNFSAVSTDRIRVNITSSIDGYAYLSEVEAWTP